MKTTQCKGCGQLVGVIESGDGKFLFVEPEAVHVNDCTPGDRLVSEDCVVFTVGGESDESEDCGYVPHWLTCKGASKFVRK